MCHYQPDHNLGRRVVGRGRRRFRSYEHIVNPVKGDEPLSGRCRKGERRRSIAWPVSTRTAASPADPRSHHSRG